MDLICPFDGLPLNNNGKTASCSGGHSFDRAKEGYLNLLPVQAKQSKDPGDSPDMVQARRMFLSQGYYNPIVTAIAAQCVTHAQGKTDLTVLDAGCGEGTYLNQIQRHLQHMHPDMALDLYGLDISKHAIKAAAKTNRAITWLVASNRQIPLAEHSLDIILCAFGFPVWHEFKRVLKPGGIVILVDPGSDHLIELRRLLYGDVVVKDATAAVPNGFTLHTTQTIRGIFHPAPDDVRQLIAMTPHQHRATTTAIDNAVQTGCPAGLTLDMVLRILQPDLFPK